MGRSGTEAAREAAAIVLTDDDFATIVAAVEEGRRIGDNIRKFVAFLLSANLGEVLVFAVAIVAGLGAPLAVIQVLLVNLVTDGAPGARARAGPGERADDDFAAAPRDAALRPPHVARCSARSALLVGGATFAAFVAGPRLRRRHVAQTMAFATLALSELALVFAIRSPHAHAWRLPRNPWLAWSSAASAGLIAALVYVPWAHGPFDTHSLAPLEAIVCIALALVPLVVIEAAKASSSAPGAGAARSCRHARVAAGGRSASLSAAGARLSQTGSSGANEPRRDRARHPRSCP